jgi:hypothetical protein
LLFRLLLSRLLLFRWLSRWSVGRRPLRRPIHPRRLAGCPRWAARRLVCRLPVCLLEEALQEGEGLSLLLARRQPEEHTPAECSRDSSRRPSLQRGPEHLW